MLVEGGCVLWAMDINGLWERCGMLVAIKGEGNTLRLNVYTDGFGLLFQLYVKMHAHVLHRKAMSTYSR